MLTILFALKILALVRTASRELWENIRDVTGRNKPSNAPSINGVVFSAEDFNQYYCKQSTDSNYVETCVKTTVAHSNCSNPITEYAVFKLLVSLNLSLQVQTASRIDSLN